MISSEHDGPRKRSGAHPVEPLHRKRNRLTLVCNVCKARKVKCDRKVPCTSCVKHHTTQKCSYTEDTRRGSRESEEKQKHSSKVLQKPTEYSQNAYLNPHQNSYLNNQNAYLNTQSAYNQNANLDGKSAYQDYPPPPNYPHFSQVPDQHQGQQHQGQQHHPHAQHPHSQLQQTQLPYPQQFPHIQHPQLQHPPPQLQHPHPPLNYHPHGIPHAMPHMFPPQSVPYMPPIYPEGHAEVNIPEKPSHSTSQVTHSSTSQATNPPTLQVTNPPISQVTHPSTSQVIHPPTSQIIHPPTLQVTSSTSQVSATSASPEQEPRYVQPSGSSPSTSMSTVPTTHTNWPKLGLESPQTTDPGTNPSEGTSLASGPSPSWQPHPPVRAARTSSASLVSASLSTPKMTPPLPKYITPEMKTPSVTERSEIAQHIPQKTPQPPSPGDVALLESFSSYRSVCGKNPVERNDEGEKDNKNDNKDDKDNDKDDQVAEKLDKSNSTPPPPTSDVFWNYPLVELVQNEPRPDSGNLNRGPFSTASMVKKDVGLSDAYSFVRLRQQEYKEEKPSVGEEEDEDDLFGDLGARILEVFPSREVLWTHVERFFQLLYPFYPFFEEECFHNQLVAILGPRDATEPLPTQLTVRKRDDLANMGILLLMIKLSYEALLSRDCAVNKYYAEFDEQRDDVTSGLNTQKLLIVQIAQLQKLLAEPIGQTAVDIVKHIVLRLQPVFGAKKPSLPILQLFSLTRVYYMLSPHEYEDPSETARYNALDAQLFENILSMGTEHEELSELNLFRKLWSFLRCHDLQLVYLWGHRLSHMPPYNDKKPLRVIAGTDHVRFARLEFMVLDCVAEIDSLLERVRSVVSVVLQLPPNVDLVELTTQLLTLEIYVAQNLGPDMATILEYARGDGTKYRYVLYVSHYLNVRMFMMNIYFHLFMHYEHNNNPTLMFFYLKKVMCVIIEEFLAHYEHLLSIDHFYFGNVLGFTLNPTIYAMLKKSNYYLLAILTRLTYTMQTLIRGDNDSSVHMANMEQDPAYREYFGRITQLLLMITKIIKKQIWILIKFAERYAYARVTVASQVLLLNSIFCEDFYSAAVFYLFCKTYTGEIQCHITHKEAYDLSRLERLCDFKLPIEHLADLTSLLERGFTFSKLTYDLDALHNQLKEVMFTEISENPNTANKFLLGKYMLEKCPDYLRAWANPFCLDCEDADFFPQCFPSFDDNLCGLLEQKHEEKREIAEDEGELERADQRAHDDNDDDEKAEEEGADEKADDKTVKEKAEDEES